LAVAFRAYDQANCLSVRFQTDYNFGPNVDVDWGKALKGKWGEAIKAIKVNQKLKITSGPNVHVVELNMKVSDPFKARYAYESD